jgi:DNA-binding transcriptional LysR family regulator
MHHQTLDLDVLRTFVAIAETGAFARAAGLVHRTPSAVSAQVKKLEDRLAKRLFTREVSGIRLTSDGQVLLGYARRLLEINEEAVNRLLPRRTDSALRLGAPQNVAEWLLPQLLTRLAADHQEVTVSLSIGESSELAKRHLDGEFDIVLLTRQAAAIPHDSELVHSEPLVWMGVRGGSAHLRRPLPISSWGEKCPWTASAVAALEGAGIPFRVTHSSSEFAAHRAAVAADLALAPFPASLAGTGTESLDVRSGFPDVGEFSVAMLLRSGAGPAVATAAETIRASYKCATRAPR